jgi:hypothetical protein
MKDGRVETPVESYWIYSMELQTGRPAEGGANAHLIDSNRSKQDLVRLTGTVQVIDPVA